MTSLSPGVYRVVASGQLYGVETWNNVFHVDATASVDHNDVLDAFEDVYNVAHTGGGTSWLNPCRGTAGGVTGVSLLLLSIQAVVTPAPPLIRTMNHTGGQNTAGGLPVDVAEVVSWRTALAGRSFRGRTYLPPWHENQNDDSTGTFPIPTAATVAAVAVNAAGLITELAGISAPLAVYSRKLSSAQHVLGGFIDNNWDTQRRRSKSQPTVRVSF